MKRESAVDGSGEEWRVGGGNQFRKSIGVLLPRLMSRLARARLTLMERLKANDTVDRQRA